MVKHLYTKEVCKQGKLALEEVYSVVVLSFQMGDVDDLEIYIAQPIWEWKQTDQGKFVIDNTVKQCVIERHIDHFSFGYKIQVRAFLEKKKLAEYYLRWGQKHESINNR